MAATCDTSSTAVLPVKFHSPAAVVACWRPPWLLRCARGLRPKGGVPVACPRETCGAVDPAPPPVDPLATTMRVPMQHDVVMRRQRTT